MKENKRVEFRSTYEGSESIGRTVVHDEVSRTIVSGDNDWTEPIDRPERDDDVTQPIGLYQGEEQQKARAVVGWLICVKGACKGQDYRLHDGWNYIGRASDLDVSIDDPKISRRMVKIAYESRSRTFVLAPCEDTKDIAYCCDKPLYSTHELSAYDRISVGDTDLMFLPLCGENFVWEE